MPFYQVDYMYEGEVHEKDVIANNPIDARVYVSLLYGLPLKYECDTIYNDKENHVISVMNLRTFCKNEDYIPNLDYEEGTPRRMLQELLENPDRIYYSPKSEVHIYIDNRGAMRWKFQNQFIGNTIRLQRALKECDWEQIMNI